ncbi:hypothetical protein [Nocardia sp. CNY236]|uniref:hypothetical protein n=1 Tax=Nocardia sp. CNY236 TaxID=1169152 RepID=UPI00048CCF67|nr:hypothetical protein [Nocardia sp. CNY236]
MKKRVVRIAFIMVLITGVGWFSFYSWKFAGVTWMFSPPQHMFHDKEKNLMTRDSPIESLGDHECIQVTSMPLPRRPICKFKGSEDEAPYFAIKWGPAEFYKYRSRHIDRFWAAPTDIPAAADSDRDRSAVAGHSAP